MLPNQRNPFAPSPRAFISYARTDGEEFAAALRSRLAAEHPEISLWQDRTRMEGGIGWWKQIAEALDRVEFLIMVMTPAAMRSEIARKEWRYARQQGVRVCPVMAVPARDLDFPELPSWMRKAHFYELEREWDTFVAFLKSAHTDNRVPFMPPDLRDDFVGRPKEFDALLCGVLDHSFMNPLPITTALQGSGGFGKTTLAVAVCHDERVISAFDDGILWATLGEEPNIQHELTKIYAALTGERPAFIDADDAAIQLATRLEDKTCLIVIDDVWDPNHLWPFLRGGTQCCRLITTRRLSVVTEAARCRVFVNEMTEDQSVQMLTARLSLDHIETEPFRALARRLGEWPLLLKLAGSQLKEQVERGDSVQGALAYVRRKLEKRGVVAFDRANATERTGAVARTVEASLELLDPKNRLRCAELAIFPEDSEVPLTTLAALWNIDEFEAGELARELDNAALLDFDVQTGSVRIHNVLQSYLYSKLEDPASIHSRLVIKGWHDLFALPDAYSWRWVGWHLARAGEVERLRSLLLDFGWLQSRLTRTEIQALLEDFELFQDHEELGAVHDAIRLGANGLSLDPGQLAVQLVGRLTRGRWAVIDRMLERATECVGRPWLKLSAASLTHPGGALLRIFKGHAGSVEALALSSDCRFVISASGDRTVRVWELESGRTTRVLEGHAGAVYCLAMTADGHQIISGSEDRNIHIWDLESGRLENTLRGHYGAVYSVATSANGRLAASMSEDGTVRVWDFDRASVISIFPIGSHQRSAVAFTPDSRYLLFGAVWTIRLHDVNTGRLVSAFEGHEGPVRALATSLDGRTVLSCGEDATIRVWDLETRELRQVFRGHTKEVDAIALIEDGRLVVSASRDRTLRVWDLSTGSVRATLEGHSGFVRTVATTPSGNKIVSGAADRTIRYWNLNSSSENTPSCAHLDAVRFLAVSADGQKAVSGAHQGSLQLWEGARTHKANALEVNDFQADLVSTLRMSADGRRVVAGLRNRTILVWDTDSGEKLCTLVGHSRKVHKLELSTNGMLGVSIASGRTVRIWDIERGRPLRTLVNETDPETTSLRMGSALLEELDMGPSLDISPVPINRDAELAISQEGTHVVMGSFGRMLAWNLRTGVTLHEDLGDFDVVSIAIDAAGRRAVLGSKSGTLRVWDVERGVTLNVLQGHDRGVLDIVILADGRTAITAASDNTIRTWDIESGQLLGTLHGKFNHLNSAAIAPDGSVGFWIYGDTIVASSLVDFAHLGSLSLDHQITTVAVAADGRDLAVGDESGSVHFLRLEA